jgi:hypothetical protein
VLVILVAPDGDVQNRVIFTARDYQQAELIEATNYLNAHYAGLTIEEVRGRLKNEIDALRTEIAALMQAAVQAGTEVLAESTDNVVVSGERNLLSVQDLGHDMSSLRRLFGVFEQKTELMRLLDVSSRAEGVRIYIGGESQVVPFEELSVVTAPYEVDGRIVGTLGVIGPTRMAYDRMIQIVDITSRLVGNVSMSGKSRLSLPLLAHHHLIEAVEQVFGVTGLDFQVHQPVFGAGCSVVLGALHGRIGRQSVRTMLACRALLGLRTPSPGCRLTPIRLGDIHDKADAPWAISSGFTPS